MGFMVLVTVQWWSTDYSSYNVHLIPVKKPADYSYFLFRSVITQGRFAGGLGQEFTEYILLGPASNSIHFIPIKMCTEAEFMNLQFR
jgi:hypothetical protein